MCCVIRATKFRRNSAGNVKVTSETMSHLGSGKNNLQLSSFFDGDYCFVQERVVVDVQRNTVKSGK